MSRLLAFRAAILIVPILLAAIPARAAGPTALEMPAPGDPDTSIPTAASHAGYRNERVFRHAGPPTPCPQAPRLPSHPGSSFAAAPTAIEPVPICRNKPMHLADFLLQTHSAFHLAAHLGRPSTGSSPTSTTLGWISFVPVPITWASAAIRGSSSLRT